MPAWVILYTYRHIPSFLGFLLCEPKCEKMYLLSCASNEDTNQLANPQSDQSLHSDHEETLILGSSKCAQWRFQSDCMNVQADTNLPWVHMSKGAFSEVAYKNYTIHCIVSSWHIRTVTIHFIQQSQTIWANFNAGLWNYQILWLVHGQVNDQHPLVQPKFTKFTCPKNGHFSYLSKKTYVLGTH